MEHLMRVSEFCKTVEVSRTTITKWIKEGLPHSKIFDGVVYVNSAEAVNWIKEYKRNEDMISMREAAKIAGVHFETIRYWKRTKPSFSVVVIQKNKISKSKFLEWLSTIKKG